MLNREYRRRCMREHMKETGQIMPSGLRRTLTYLAGVAALFLGAIIIAVFILVRCFGFRSDLGWHSGLMFYLMWTPILFIAYTRRFWSVPHQMFLVDMLCRAALCGVLFPILQFFLCLFFYAVLGDSGLWDIFGTPGIYVMALAISVIVSIALTRICIVPWSLKQPQGEAASSPSITQLHRVTAK